MGPGKVLIAETQRIFHHRDEVFSEILKFAGIPDFKLDLPKVVSCKAERYKGTYAGCYSGRSRVADRTHAIFDALPFVRQCRRRLERLVGDVHLFDLNATDLRVKVPTRRENELGSMWSRRWRAISRRCRSHTGRAAAAAEAEEGPRGRAAGPGHAPPQEGGEAEGGPSVISRRSIYITPTLSII